MDNFKNHPKSISEVKANQADNSTLWTPRDALISLLRKIDDGEEEVTDLVIGYRYKLGDNLAHNFVNATKEAVVAWGLWSRINHLLHH